MTICTTSKFEIVSAIEKLVSIKDGSINADGFVERGNAKIKLLRFVMRNRSELFHLIGSDVSESEINSAVSEIIADSVYVWDSRSTFDVAKAYGSHFAFAYGMLHGVDADSTIFNIARFVKLSRSCMTPDPNISGRVDSLPMDDAVRNFFLLENFKFDNLQEFFACVNRGEPNTVACNVWVRRCRVSGDLTTFRFLTWNFGSRVCVDKVYHSGSGEDLREFKKVFSDRVGEEKTAFFREHNHLIDSDDGETVGFRRFDNYSLRSAYYPTMVVNVDRCNGRFPYLDTFRYLDGIDGAVEFRCEPDDDTRYTADSCSGGFNDFDGLTTRCGCCGDSTPDDQLIGVDNCSVSENGLVCETCYCDEIGHCSGCDSQIAINHDRYATVSYEHYCDHCFEINN